VSETAESPNAPRNALPLSAPARSALVLTSLAMLGWALVALFGWSGLPGVAGGLGIAAFSAWKYRGRAARAEQQAVTTALRTLADPGSALRPVVTSTARRQLASPAADRWGPGAVLAAVAVACVATAIVRHELATALPAAPLAVLAVVVLMVIRRADALAQRWLADPPRAHDQEPSR
jgi:hypothetical protein